MVAPRSAAVSFSLDEVECWMSEVTPSMVAYHLYVTFTPLVLHLAPEALMVLPTFWVPLILAGLVLVKVAGATSAVSALACEEVVSWPDRFRTTSTVIFSFDGAAELAREVGAALGLPETGEALAQRTTAEVEQAVTEARALAPAAEPLRMVFLYIRGNSGIYYLFGEDSGASELIRAVGGTDVAGELGWTEMQPLTDEAMVAAAPDLILVMTHGLESAGGVDGLLADKPAIALTPAGERRRLVDMADADILSFGPRSAGVVTALARAIYLG